MTGSRSRTKNEKRGRTASRSSKPGSLLPEERLSLTEVFTRQLPAIFCAILMAKLFWISATPLDLAPDEAYSWDWSRQLDYGYAGKPPLIAWLIAAVTAVGGHSAFVVRVPAAILSTLALIPVYRLGREMFGERGGLFALLGVGLSPGSLASGFLMTTDAPLLCAWSFALWFTWRLLNEENPSPRSTAGAILAGGLGLLSRQTMLGFFVLAFVAVLRQREHRRRNAGRLALVTFFSLLFLVPVVIWNSQHQWATFPAVGSSLQFARHSFAAQARFFGEFFGSQLLLVTPILFATLIHVVLRSWRSMDARVGYLLSLSILGLLPVFVLALTQRVQPGVPAPLYLAGFILLGGLLSGELVIPGLSDRQVRFWRWPAYVLEGLISVGLIAAITLIPNTSLAGGPYDPTIRLRGWKTLGQALQDAAKSVPVRNPYWIATTRLGPVSELAFYLPSHPRVYHWTPISHRDSQHDLWGGPQPFEPRDIFIVTRQNEAIPEALAKACQSTRLVSRIRIPLGKGRLEGYDLYLGTGLDHWPERQQQ